MYVYLISNGTHTKIGMSGDPLSRLTALRTSAWDSLNIECLWALPNKETAIKFEVFLHSLFKAYRSSGEWFLIKPREIVDKVNQITLIEKIGADGVITPHKEALQKRCCKGCGETYKPVSISQKFCTQTCKNETLQVKKRTDLNSNLAKVSDSLYPSWVDAIKQGTVTTAKAATQKFIWKHSVKPDDSEGLTANETAKIWQAWKKRGAEEGALLKNPAYKPGNRKPEYLPA